ncbi:hypothetical protein GCM10027074_11050 [Streptomyces deserti]
MNRAAYGGGAAPVDRRHIREFDLPARRTQPPAPRRAVRPETEPEDQLGPDVGRVDAYHGNLTLVESDDDPVGGDVFQ